MNLRSSSFYFQARSNIWINILWRKISKPRRGGRLIYREIFNLQQMLEFLRQAVDRIYQVREAIYLPSD